MLKIKDDVKFRQLKKLGFIKCSVCERDSYVYDFVRFDYCNSYNSYLVIDVKTKQLNYEYIANEDCGNMRELFADKLFELIQAGLVEKVADHE